MSRFKDCMQWCLLPPATQAVRSQSKLATGRFTGDPSYAYEDIITAPETGDRDAEESADKEKEKEEEEKVVVKEENRLAAVIADIDEDVWIVPRGAFIRTPTGEITANRSFGGMSVSDAAKLVNYSHFRAPTMVKSLLQLAKTDRSIDFMDTLDEDVPHGSWSLQFDRGSGLVVLRSLLWQGYAFFYVPGTPNFGSVYFGDGVKNVDLPFML